MHKKPNPTKRMHSSSEAIQKKYMHYILYFVKFHLYLIIIQICEFTTFITPILGAYEDKIQHPPFNFLLNSI